jgi:hypothetical protein
MNLHPILLHSTRRKDKLGLLSLTKYNLSLVMGFLDEQVRRQAILSSSSRAKKDIVAPPPALHVLSATLEVHNPFVFYVWIFGDFDVFLLVFSLIFCFFHFNTFMLHSLLLKHPYVQRVKQEIQSVQPPPPPPLSRQHLSLFANFSGSSPLLVFETLSSSPFGCLHAGCRCLHVHLCNRGKARTICFTKKLQR